MRLRFTTYVLLLAFLYTNISALNGVYRWECKDGSCLKTAITPETEETALSLSTCRLFCSDVAALWPKPTGNVDVGKTLSVVNVYSINPEGINDDAAAYSIWDGAVKSFTEQIVNMLPSQTKASDSGKTLDIIFTVTNPNVKDLELEVKEGYSLTVTETEDDHIKATIVADNVFGARNGLQTLRQLIVYDDLRDEVVVPSTVTITDEPVYPYRGLLLDTARNYISVEAIKRTINAMGASKLNSFHWHITDSHSFPFTAESLPDLQKYGAYSPKKIYTPEEVAEIVQLGLENGVRVIPEFDAPAHVGEGWQNTDLVVCFAKQPWQSYCVEPPCGQFNPTKDELYDKLELLYKDMIKQFNPPIFHMGGDEVNFNCWKSSEEILTWMNTTKEWGDSEADFVKLWDYFQSQALERLYKITGKQIPVILWTSTLTQIEYLETYLPKDKYIIQIWTAGNDQQVTNLLDSGYKVIISNYDALYLDCGLGGWVNNGESWCSPYKAWHKVYDNKPSNIAGDKKHLVMGAEAALWTEQADSASVDSRLWPRTAALAEVLWSEPNTTYAEADNRMLAHRERLIDLGINADALQPEWCRQYQESCPIGAVPEEVEDNDSSTGGGRVSVNPTLIIFMFASFVVAIKL